MQDVNPYSPSSSGNNGAYEQPKSDVGSPYTDVGSPYTIVLRFEGGLTTSQQDACKRAANFWSRAIVGGLSPVEVDGEIVKDILILVEGVPYDGPGGILGQAGPTYLRPANAERGALLPAKAELLFDIEDLTRLEGNGRLDAVIKHEMCHALGFGAGATWFQKDLVRDIGGANPVFIGASAMKEYAALRGLPEQSIPVPIENVGGPGTAGSHWREADLKDELMSGIISGQNNPLSLLTLASLQDLGYVVNFAVAEPYALPNLLQIAARGGLRAPASPHEDERFMSFLPAILRPESLR